MAETKATGDHIDLNIAVCRALGIDEDKIVKLTITFDGHATPVAEITRLVVDPEDSTRLTQALERYEFTVREKTVETRCLVCNVRTPAVCHRHECPGVEAFLYPSGDLA